MVYKGGLKQESEQCVTSTVTNGAHWMSPGKGRRASFPKEWRENGESVSIDHSAGDSLGGRRDERKPATKLAPETVMHCFRSS